MEHFGLDAWGTSFRDPAFISEVSLDSQEPWVQGDVAGISIRLSREKTLTLEEQVKTATEFLQINRETLRRISANHGVDSVVLRLEVQVEFDAEDIAFGINVSELLMWHVLDTQIRLGFLVVIKNRIVHSLE